MVQPFVQTSSFTRRLRRILSIIAAFFLFGVASTYVTNKGLLDGLQSINNANRISNLATLALETMATADQSVSKIKATHSLKVIEYTFQQSIELSLNQVDEAISNSQRFPKVNRILQKARQSLEDYRASTLDTFEAIRSGRDTQSDEFKTDLLLALEFSADAKESLRVAQISLKDYSDTVFRNIYSNRFIPLLVATLLSLMFFAFVVLVGLSSAKRLSLSIGNLENATTAVAEGDLDFKAPIMQSDEFGKLTYEFNSMVESLHSNRKQLNVSLDRISRLQEITAALAEALIPNQVFEVIFDLAFSSLQISSGAVGIIDVEKNTLKLQRVKGYEENLIDSYQEMDMSSVVPIVDAAKFGRPVFVENLEQVGQEYPSTLQIHEESGLRATAAFPLIVDGKVIGAIAFSFKEDQSFDQSQRDFLKALVSQCSQALHRSQLYQAAREAIELRDEFLSIASHELRTPLTPLKLQLQKLAREVKKGRFQEMPNEQILKSVESSDRQVNRLTSLIDDLLDVARISSGKLTLNKEEFALDEMVEEVVSHYRHHLKESDSTIELEVEKNIKGYFDKVRIEQVFINLLTNAAKYAPKKPIHVCLKRVGDQAELKVKDQGQGIPKKDQQRIFDRFERVRDRDNVGGLGLGLYISRQIIDAHDGNIKVESVPGDGATFIVHLPLTEKDSTDRR